jgi:hypothetical protein
MERLQPVPALRRTRSLAFFYQFFHKHRDLEDRRTSSERIFGRLSVGRRAWGYPITSYFQRIPYGLCNARDDSWSETAQAQSTIATLIPEGRKDIADLLSTLPGIKPANFHHVRDRPGFD